MGRGDVLNHKQVARVDSVRNHLKEARLQSPVLTNRNRIRGVASWMSKHIIVMSKTLKSERSLRRYGRHRRKEDTLTRGDPIREDGWEVSRRHSSPAWLVGMKDGMLPGIRWSSEFGLAKDRFP